MDGIKIDVDFIIEQSEEAKDALENMLYCINELRDSYSEMLENMKSSEFICEFDESLAQLIEETNKISDETIEAIISALENLADVFGQADINLSEM